jgi:hypothetical protein
MTPTSLIVYCHENHVILTPVLEFDGPDAVLGAEVLEQLRSQKNEILRVLLGPPGADPRTGLALPDWRGEWLREMGLLALRWRDTVDHDAKALLRELLAETPRTLDQWLILGGMIRDAEFDLRKAGKLPPIPNFGS